MKYGGDHKFRWSVQKGESFQLSLNEGLGNKLCPLRNFD